MTQQQGMPGPGTAEIAARLVAMQQAQQREGPPSALLRKDRIRRAIGLLQANESALVDAVNADFGCRSCFQTRLTDVMASIVSLRDSLANLEDWMSATAVAEPFPGVRARIAYQPLGVVGIVSPWNFPLVLAFGPLAGVFAAGNRAMLKPSELTPQTAALLAELVARDFDVDELSTVLGGPETGAAFCAQPFDHLIYTGSTAVARHVMRAASDHLVPLTLELGGKSPVIVSSGADLAQAAQRILTAKTFNAGQICLAPDYVLLPTGSEEAFVQHARAAVSSMYPGMRDNPDYTALLNQQGFARQRELVEDARRLGAQVIELAPAGEDLSDSTVHKMAPTLLLGVTDAMRVMHEEIFGPVLPVLACDGLEQAIAQVNRNPRPLALYFFGDDPAEQAVVAERTVSGGLVFNDIMTHVFVESLPFGGVGASGMGHYHGIHGFRAFSHARSILTQSKGGESNLLMRAPFGPPSHAMVDSVIAGMQE